MANGKLCPITESPNLISKFWYGIVIICWVMLGYLQIFAVHTISLLISDYFLPFFTNWGFYLGYLAFYVV